MKKKNYKTLAKGNRMLEIKTINNSLYFNIIDILEAYNITDTEYKKFITKVKKLSEEIYTSGVVEEKYIAIGLTTMLISCSNSSIALDFQLWVSADVLFDVITKGMYLTQEKSSELLNNASSISTSII